MPSTTASRPWQGVARLTYQVRHGHTVPIAPYTQAPLRLQRPFYPADGVCHSTLVHTAGGMVAGDQLTINAALDPRSQVLLTTAAAHKLYGAGQPDAPPAQQTIHLQLAPHSILEWMPQETVVFDGARYRQQVRVDLAETACWLGLEITRFGRSARNEQFAQGQWHSATEVWQGAHPLWIDRLSLTGGTAPLTSANGLAGQPVVGTLALVGRTIAPDQVDRLRQLWAPDQPGETGISSLPQGVVCRYRGPSSQVARRWFLALWQQLRPWYGGPAAPPLRVWGL